MLEQQETSAFAGRIAKFLERVEYRRADSPRDKEAIYRLRYEAYSREGYIERNESKLFTDAGDQEPNSWMIGVFIDGALASSIRLNVASRPKHWLSAMECYGDILGPRIASGEVFVDATRQSSRLEFTRAYPFLPLITMRCGFLAMEYFKADFLIGSCRSEYELAFRRMFGSRTWSTPRPYPLLNRLHVLMAFECKTQWRGICERYPFLASTAIERRALFGRSSNAGPEVYGELNAGGRVSESGNKDNSAICAA